MPTSWKGYDESSPVAGAGKGSGGGVKAKTGWKGQDEPSCCMKSSKTPAAPAHPHEISNVKVESPPGR